MSTQKTAPLPSPPLIKASQQMLPLSQAAAYYAQGNYQESLRIAQQALAHDAANGPLLNLAAAGAFALGRAELAEQYWRQTVHFLPDFDEGLNNLSALLIKLQRFDEAEALLRRSLRIKPRNPAAHCSLGHVLLRLKRIGEAESCFRKSLIISPNNAKTLTAFANMFQESRRFKEAEASYRKAIAVDGDYVDAHYYLGLLLLSLGRLEEGWRCCESRYDPRLENTPNRVAATFPQWQGESLAGKSILVFYEQGFGDTIQFCRYLPLLQSQGARVTLLCLEPLETLLNTLAGVDKVLSHGRVKVLPGHDYWTFLLSLPWHCKTTLDSIPAGLPYLAAPPGRIDKWRSRLPQSGIRVGLVWQGNPTHVNDANRSLPGLRMLAPLWGDAGIAFISLQKGRGEEEASQALPDQAITCLGADIGDFADTAAIVSQLDLVICVDTAIAHLAGALGKPCWVMLPYAGTDWRWLQERGDSPWYPGVMRLFRQKADGDWAAVVGEVAAELQAWRVKQRPGRPAA